MYKIMLIDDEENMLNALKRTLNTCSDWEVNTYNSGAEAIRRAEANSFDLFISDFRMPQMNGVEFLSKVKQLQPNAIRIILSGYADLETLTEAINEAEIFRFINKPWNNYELILTIQQALKYKDMLTENLYLANQLRDKSKQLSKKDKILAKLENESPGITKVNWSDDGAIIIDDK